MCTCPEGHIAPSLHQNTLPLVTKNIVIEQHQDKIAAHTKVGSAIHVQLSMENAKVAALQSQAQCCIKASTITGCYACLLGAKVSIVCRLTEEEATADLTCDTQHQIAICTKNGKLNEIVFHFDTPKVSTTCTICSGGQSSFQLDGMLDYVNDAQIQREISNNNEENIDETGNVFVTVFEWIYSFPDAISTFFANLNILTYIKTLLACSILLLFTLCIASSFR
ncbi:unnamed protein product [Heligmosomoides polygyrus]|uniref:Phlebovirus_G2 domain-containing protein n=1 Tax=Heligmosomoides polygyrus TaxID=6339 RepID=A0A183GNS7_HELPZ|nr:unnamed protein product [Heligmosomoides polygyrus]